MLASHRIRRVQALTAALMNTKVQQACKQTGLADYVQGQLHRATRDLYTAVIALRPETTTAHFCDRQHQHHQHVVSAGINALNRLALVMLVVLVSLAVWGHPAVRQASPSALWGTVEGLGRESAAVRTLFARPMAIVHAAARQLFQASFLSSDILVSSHPSLLSACVLSEAKGLMFLVAVVLLLPSLYTQQQLLGMVRLEAVDITNSAAGKDETDAKGAYLSAREATSTMQEGLKTISEAKSLPQNWLHEINPGALGGRLNVSTGLHLALCNGTLSDAFTTKVTRPLFVYEY